MKNGWTKQEAGYYTHQVLGKCWKDWGKWWFYPKDGFEMLNHGPHKTLTDAIATAEKEGKK